MAEHLAYRAACLLQDQEPHPGNAFEVRPWYLSGLRGLLGRVVKRPLSQAQIRHKKNSEGWYPWLENWYDSSPQSDILGKIPTSLIRSRRRSDNFGRITLHQYQPAALHKNRLHPDPSAGPHFFEIYEELPLKNPAGAWITNRQIFFHEAGALGAHIPQSPGSDLAAERYEHSIFQDRNPDEYGAILHAGQLFQRIDRPFPQVMRPRRKPSA